MSRSNQRAPVVVTRDAERAAPLATRLAAHGIDVVALPCTRIEPTSPAERAAIADRLAAGDVDAVVVPSVNAAAALAGARLAGARVIAVGPATRDALAAAGIAAEAPDRADAIGAADALLAGAPPRAVVWLRAEGGREDGIDRLRAAGVAVDEAIVYRTVARPAGDPALAEGLAALPGAAVVAIYAPSQVDALDGLVAGGLAALAAPLVAIGDTTAAAIRARGAAVAAIAAAPDPDAMARAITAVYPRGR